MNGAACAGCTSASSGSRSDSDTAIRHRKGQNGAACAGCISAGTDSRSDTDTAIGHRKGQAGSSSGLARAVQPVQPVQVALAPVDCQANPKEPPPLAVQPAGSSSGKWLLGPAWPHWENKKWPAWSPTISAWNDARPKIVCMLPHSMTCCSPSHSWSTLTCICACWTAAPTMVHCDATTTSSACTQCWRLPVVEVHSGTCKF